MIIGSLTQTKRFEILHPDFKKVFEYVRSGNWQQVTAGKIILEEDKIWVNVDEVTGKSREAAKLEAHNRFIDIQIPLLRHRAALGLSGVSDAYVVVVSEETGNITFFKDGSFKVKVSPEELKKFLSNDFSGFVVK